MVWTFLGKKGVFFLAIAAGSLTCAAGIVLQSPKAKKPYITASAFLALSVVLVVLAWPKPDHTKREPLLQAVRSNFAKLNPKFAKIPLYAGKGAYTDNKEKITLCLTDPVTNQPYDANTIMYVALHELAHVISHGVGHGKEFMENFERLRQRASVLGFFDPSVPITKTYCGTT